MGERFFEPNDNDIINHDLYQAYTQELLYNVLSRTNPTGSISQPSEEQGRQSLELLPQIEDGDASWDSVCLIVHPANNFEEDGSERLATLQLVQPLTEQAEFIKEYTILIRHNRYYVKRSFVIFDYDNHERPEYFFFTELADAADIQELTDCINSASVRPVDI